MHKYNYLRHKYPHSPHYLKFNKISIEQSSNSSLHSTIQNAPGSELRSIGISDDINEVKALACFSKSSARAVWLTSRYRRVPAASSWVRPSSATSGLGIMCSQCWFARKTRCRSFVGPTKAVKARNRFIFLNMNGFDIYIEAVTMKGTNCDEWFNRNPIYWKLWFYFNLVLNMLGLLVFDAAFYPSLWSVLNILMNM